MPLTYTDYLRVNDLLALQRPLSSGPEHDELLFIIIHQVYELWFKQVLHELDYLGRLLREGDTPRALHTFRRILTILKTLVAQIDVLETMTPLEFLSFRSRLESASGFESYQFRELEFRLGQKRQHVLRHYPEGTPARAQLEARYRQPALWDDFLRYLADQGLPVPATELERDVTEAVTSSTAVQDVLIDVYRQRPILSRVCERLVDLDEGLQEWRYRHVKMVERTIGNKPGTGGSSGVDYLSGTLFQPLFADLWAIRTRL